MCKRIVPSIVLLVMVMVSAPGGFAEEPAPPPTPIATAVRPADDAVMVSVPAGEFLMGSVEGEASSDAELPQHPVDLDAYWIDRTEVTNRQFEAFVKATGHVTEAEKEGKSKVFASSGASGIFGDKMVAGADWRHPEGPDSDIAGRMENPVVHVTWSDAAAFCEWAGARLPSEAEWEKTCRGTDARAYPWGGSTRSCEYTVMWDPNSGRGCGAGDTALPVGSRPAGASPYGALDMSGNVWEWVNDWYDDDYYARSPAKNPPGPEKGTQKLGRGGSWAVTGVGHRCDLRAGTDTPTGRDNQTGFRCAVSESAFKAAVPAAETAATASILLSTSSAT